MRDILTSFVVDVLGKLRSFIHFLYAEQYRNTENTKEMQLTIDYFSYLVPIVINKSAIIIEIDVVIIESKTAFLCVNSVLF